MGICNCTREQLRVAQQEMPIAAVQAELSPWRLSAATTLGSNTSTGYASDREAEDSDSAGSDSSRRATALNGSHVSTNSSTTSSGTTTSSNSSSNGSNISSNISSNIIISSSRVSSKRKRRRTGDPRTELVDTCQAEGIAFLPHGALGGLKARRGERSLVDRWPGLAPMASGLGVSPHALVLAWMRHRWPCIVHIAGARREAHVRDCHASLRVRLSEQEASEIGAMFGGEV